MQELEKRIYSKFNEIQGLVDYAEELVDKTFELEGNLLDIGDDSDDEYCEVEMEIREKAEKLEDLYDEITKHLDSWKDLINELKEKIKDKDFSENKGKVQELLKKLGIIDKMGGYFERKSSINLNFLHFFNHLWIPIFCFKCQNTASNEFVVVGSCIFSFRNS